MAFQQGGKSAQGEVEIVLLPCALTIKVLNIACSSLLLIGHTHSVNYIGSLSDLACT
jgi:hypothetical protein